MKGSTRSEAAFRFMRWATSNDYLELVAGTAGWADIPPGTRSSVHPNSPSCQPVPCKGIDIVCVPEFADLAAYVGAGLVKAVHGEAPVLDWLTDAQDHIAEAMTAAGHLTS